MTSQEQRLQRQVTQDRAFRGDLFFALLVLLALVGIIASLVIGSMPSIKAFGFNFLVSES